MTLEELKQINTLYNQKYELDENDMKLANQHIKNIENSRNNKIPQIGDILELTTKHGDFYENAHIDGYNRENDKLEICQKPYTPSIVDSSHGLSLSTSGGIWQTVPRRKLRYIGKRQKLFWFWGSCGPCANGGIDIIATVNVWRYEEPESFFGKYSTEFYNKLNFRFLEKPTVFGYTILGSGEAFTTKKDYEIFKKTYRAVAFPSPYVSSAETIFIYKEIPHYIKKEQWDNLKDCQIDTRICNGSIITVKVKYDDENKKIDVYRYSNHFEPDEEIAKCPYILNRN